MTMLIKRFDIMDRIYKKRHGHLTSSSRFSGTNEVLFKDHHILTHSICELYMRVLMYFTDSVLWTMSSLAVSRISIDSPL